MSKSKGITIPTLNNPTGRAEVHAHNEVAVQPGHGHSRLNLQDELARRGSAREATLPSPANPGGRLDATQPSPVTRHVKSNTVRGERFHAGHGDTRGGHNETERQAMDRSLEPPGRRATTADSPVPLGTQHPDLAVRSKPEEIRKNDPNMGLGETFPARGNMDR